jgi:hypothetical protein
VSTLSNAWKAAQLPVVLHHHVLPYEVSASGKAELYAPTRSAPRCYNWPSLLEPAEALLVGSATYKRFEAGIAATEHSLLNYAAGAVWATVTAPGYFVPSSSSVPVLANTITSYLANTNSRGGTITLESYFAGTNSRTAAQTFACLISTRPDYPAIPTIEEVSSTSELADQILSERPNVELSGADAKLADAATKDAVKLVRRAKLGGNPRIMFSDDGILTLQWQRGEYGLALIFAGDGTASIAFRRPDQFYAENGIEIAISDDLPAAFTEAMTAILT